jgi:murein L,D-transpeptidase YcbB/YkuD
MRYLGDVHSGRISPKYFKFGLDVRHKRYEVADFLRARLVSAKDVAPVLADVEPPYPGYLRTKAALERYLTLEKAGDLPPLPRVKKPVKPGDVYPNLAQLDQRLRQLGDLAQDAAADAQSGTYQGARVEAVKHFQQRHELSALWASRPFSSSMSRSIGASHSFVWRWNDGAGCRMTFRHDFYQLTSPDSSCTPMKTNTSP